MATYYVSPAGSDSNNGLGPNASDPTNKPWLTVGKALGASGISSGDTVYLAPGTYRETVTVAMTSPVATTSILGDPANAQGFRDATGERLTPGDVILTAYTTDDKTNPAAATTLNVNSRDNLAFSDLGVIGGDASPSAVSSGSSSTDCTFTRCLFVNGRPANPAVTITGIVDTASNWTISRCIFAGGSVGMSITLPTSTVADYDCTIQVQNCLFHDSTAGSAGGVTLFSSGANSFKGGGVDVLNCTFVNHCALNVTSASISTTIPCTIYNSLLATMEGACLVATTSGQITEDYNVLISDTGRTNVSAGANSVGGASPYAYAALVTLGVELFGRQHRPPYTPLPGFGGLGFGNQSGSPAVDLLGLPRPAGSGLVWGTALKGVGALERPDGATVSPTLTHDGAGAYRIPGPGVVDLFQPVDAGRSTALSVWVQWDGTYAGTKPQMLIVDGDEVGVATATATATGSANVWEQLSLTFTPTRTGVLRVRLQSNSTAGGGVTTFDSLAVSV